VSKIIDYSTYIGKKFGKLNILEIFDVRKNHLLKYARCLCDCGETCDILLSNLKRGHTSSCGCHRKNQDMNRKKIANDSLIGKKFGMLVILNVEKRINKNKLVRCVCDCGNTFVGYLENIKSGKTISCGCYRKNRSGIDHDLFKDLDDESAYWIGFLMADGNIESMKNNVNVTLQIGDRDHIEKFKKFTKGNNSIREISQKRIYKNIETVGHYSRYSFTSDEVVKTLSLYGVVPRKSLTATPSPLVSGNKHFWRGVIDGDGCISRDLSRFRPILHPYPKGWLEMRGA
jgi:hypothetical protein